MSKDFQNVRMTCREDREDHLVVEQGDGMPDKLFFELGGSSGSVYLNTAQVAELTRRMTAWLAGQSDDDRDLWEDI